jgi:hypothetical protein
MIDTLISILDRLIQLKEYRTKRIQHIYSELLEPVFVDLSAIHKDYLQMFTKLSSDVPFDWEKNLPGYQERLEKVVDFFQRKRLEFEPTRSRVRMMARELECLSISPEVEGFVDSVICYLFGTVTFHENQDLSNYSEYKSVSETVLERLEIATQKRTDSRDSSHLSDSIEDDIRSMVELIVIHQKASWEKSCSAFSKLKISIATQN